MSGIVNKEMLESVRRVQVTTTEVLAIHPELNRETGNQELQEIPQISVWDRPQDGDGWRYLACRHPKFAIIKNRDIIRAMDEVAYDKGITLRVDHASYRKGKTMINFVLPGKEFTVDGDSSPIKPGILTGNHYGGGGAYRHQPSSIREICSNGMISKTDLAMANSRKHFGVIEYEDIYLMTANALDNLDRAVEIMKLTSRIAAKTVITDNQIVEMMDSIMEKTAKKHQLKISEVVADNVHKLGNTAWAVVQGISEAYHHHMGEDHSGAKMSWRDQSIDKVLADAGVNRELVLVRK